MRVFEANCLTLLPTNVCNAECRHCSMNAGPRRRDSLSFEQLESIIRQVYEELSNLEVLVFSGGESTLLGDDLPKTLRLCKELRSSVIIRLVTNAHWARSRADAERYLRTLREAGLDELNISTDDYHLPWVSLQRVRDAFYAALDIGFLSVVLCNAFGPDSWLTPQRVDDEFGAGKPMQRRFGDDGFGLERSFDWEGTNVLLSNCALNHLGRGSTRLRRGEVSAVGEQLYTIADQLSGCPWAIRSAAVSAKGHLLACCGFEVEDNPILDYGSIGEHSLSVLLDRADRDVISNMIGIVGPPQLKRILEEICPGDVRFPRPDYASYCEVCEDLIGIPQNRQALYRCQGLFADTVLSIREQYRQDYEEDGSVRIPAGVRLQYRFDVRHGAGPAPEASPEASRLAPCPDSAPVPPRPRRAAAGSG